MIKEETMAFNYVYPSPVIAERIQKVFDDNKLTDSMIAGAIGCERKCICVYRNCYTNPSIKFLRYLAATYHVSISWLMDMEG